MPLPTRPNTPDFDSPREYVNLDYLPPNMLSLEELRDQINERRAFVLNYLLNESGLNSYGETSAFVLYNKTFDRSMLYQRVDELTVEDDNPDFRINVFTRILYTTNEYNDILLPAIAQIPLWITPGEERYLYWTENHHILFTVAAYLLRQRFSSYFPEGYFDEGLDERLAWILRVKQKYSLFEFGSPLYMKISLHGLINLYDFAEDENIREEAKKCVLKIFRDWMEQMNSAGVSCVSSGRSDQLFYYQNVDMFGRGFQQVLFIATGLGPFVKFYDGLNTGTMAFLLSDIDVSEAINTYSPEESFLIRSIGGTDDDLFYPLKGNDRTVIEISMGSYINPDYIKNFYNLFEEKDMLDHDILGGMGPAFRALTFPFMRRLVSTIISTISTGSLLVVPELAIYKYDAVTLTSCQDYFPGYKGYQQIPSMAIVKNTSVFTYAMKEEHFMDADEGISQTANNNQLPKLHQTNNILLALYNRNFDMDILGVDGTEIIFYMNYSHYEEIDIDKSWVFGRIEESYVGVHRYCLNDVEEHIFSKCTPWAQSWITVVGNDAKYGSFDTFKSILSSSEIEVSHGQGCIYFSGIIDSILMEDKLCRRIGNSLVAIICLTLFLISLCMGCFFCCTRRKSAKQKPES